jgi:hypothetical protein
MNRTYSVKYVTEKYVNVTYEQAQVGLEAYNRDIDVSDDLMDGAEYYARVNEKHCDVSEEWAECEGIWVADKC